VVKEFIRLMMDPGTKKEQKPLEPHLSKDNFLKDVNKKVPGNLYEMKAKRA
jgi:hypothetical protein